MAASAKRKHEVAAGAFENAASLRNFESVPLDVRDVLAQQTHSSSSTAARTGSPVALAVKTNRPAAAAAMRATAATQNVVAYPKRFATAPAMNELMPTNRSTKALSTPTADPRLLLGI